MTRAEFIRRLDSLKEHAGAVGMGPTEAIDAAADLAIEYMKSRPLTVDEAVDEAMTAAIDRAESKCQAARELGIDRRTLHRWLERKIARAEPDGVPRAGS